MIFLIFFIHILVLLLLKIYVTVFEFFFKGPENLTYLFWSQENNLSLNDTKCLWTRSTISDGYRISFINLGENGSRVNNIPSPPMHDNMNYYLPKNRIIQ